MSGSNFIYEDVEIHKFYEKDIYQNVQFADVYFLYLSMDKSDSADTIFQLTSNMTASLANVSVLRHFVLSIHSSRFDGFNLMNPPAEWLIISRIHIRFLKIWPEQDIALWNRFRFWLNQTWPWIAILSLQWRQNERDDVSNHQPHDCLLNRLFGSRWKKH